MFATLRPTILLVRGLWKVGKSQSCMTIVKSIANIKPAIQVLAASLVHGSWRPNRLSEVS